MNKTSRKVSSLLSSVLVVTTLIASCHTTKAQKEIVARGGTNMKGFTSSPAFPVIQLPKGYMIEKVADKLSYATAVAWDDQGRMYVVEAGGAFLDEEAPARLLRVEQGGKVTEVANLTEKGLGAPVTALQWYDGAFYFTHRDGKDRTGAVSRMTLDGNLKQLFNGFIDSQTDHFLNDIRMGPDGRMYFTSGIGGNCAVMGEDMLPFITKSPQTHATSAKDIVLTGMNFLTLDFRTKEQGDTALTGAFVPFGTATMPGQVIKGTNKPGGAILSFDPKNPDATMKTYAWGFRNIIGLAWNKNGEMFATQNGYDVSPSRPIKDEYDATYRIRANTWYGVPDFSAALEPLTDPKFTAPGRLQAAAFIDGIMQEKKLGFLIDHKASGLTPPERSLILGLHPVNSSPSKPDIAPNSWGDMAGNLFIPEWGDMAWVTNALRDKPAGNRIVFINPTAKGNTVVPFIFNAKPGAASEQGALGKGIERPYDVKFGPDGAMYIVDFGTHKITLSRIADGHLPFEFPPETGVIWKVTKVK